MNKTLNRAFPIVAAALGNKFGVNVVVGGTDAMTNGKTIILPGYNLDDPSYKDIAWGYLAHEAGHIRNTDFGCVAQSSSSPLRKDICNILEDIRIERAMMGLYPGTKNTILAMDESICRSSHYRLPAADSHPAAILSQFLFLRLTVDVLGFRSLGDLADQIESMLEQVFPSGAVTRLFGLLADVPSLQSTREALALTDRILRMIEEEQEKAKQQSPSNPNAVDDNNEPDNAIEPSGVDNTDDASNSGNGDEADSETTVEASTGSDEDGNPDSIPDSPSPVDVLSKVLDAAEEDLPEGIAAIARSVLADQPSQCFDANINMPLAVMPVKHPDGHALVQSVLSESAKIRFALQGLVQTETQDHVITRGHGLKVNGSKLSRLAVGDPKVFDHRTIKRKPSLADHLVVDLSGSMAKKIGTKSMAHIAIEAAVALALAFESIPGVNTGITRFPYQDTSNVVPLLRHGQKVRPNAGHFAATADGCSTPLHSALWYAASAVLATKEERKVIIVVTDGDPDSRSAAQAIIERCKASGIELIGIGIGHSIGHLFDVAIRVDDVRQLRGELFRIGRQLLAA